MAELGILAAVGIVGYLLNQREKETEIKDNNNEQIAQYLAKQALATQENVGTDIPYANSYPTHNPEYVKHQQNAMNGIKQENIPKRKTHMDKTKHFMEKKGQEDFTNFVPANDPTSDNLLDMQERPMADFTHNNMIPFFKGSGTNQNMAGTGIAQADILMAGDQGNVNAGFDNSTPYQAKLGSFTGLDDTYLHKRETGPLFSPAETATGWVHGAPNIRPDMDRYKEGLDNIRNDLKPLEPQMVGPGLNIDPEIPAQGGFHEFTRVLPNNVGEYKANQLPGRVNSGKYHSTGLPTSYPGVGVSKEMDPSQTKAPGITKNKPDKFWDQTRYPTMTAKVGFQNDVEFQRPDYTAAMGLKSNMRDQTNYGLGNLSYKQQGQDPDYCVDGNIGIGQGPLGANVPQSATRGETFMSQDNNIRSLSDCNSFPIGNAARPDMGQGNIVSNWYVNETDRGTVAAENVLNLNANRQDQGHTFYTYKDEPKNTTKETTQFSYSGNAAQNNLGTKFWTYEDEMAPTHRESTNAAYTGGIGNRGGIGAMTNRTQFTGIEIEVEE